MKQIIFLFLLMICFVSMSQAQILLKQETLSNKMHSYVLGFKGIKKAKSMFVSGEMSKRVVDNKVVWDKIPIYDTDGDGLYEYTIVTYNKLIKYYVSGEGVKWNPNLSKEPTYDSESQCLVTGFVDGGLVSQSEFKLQYPGKWGDEFIRGETVANGKIAIICNLTYVEIPSGVTADYPFFQVSPKWDITRATILNSWGWALILLNPEDIEDQDAEGNQYPGILRLGYGIMTTTGEKLWPAFLDKCQFWVKDVGIRINFN